MSTQLSWRSWAAELTSQSTLIESVSNKTKVVYTLVYRTQMPPQARQQAESGLEWKSPKRVVGKRGCRQTPKSSKIASKQPVKAKMIMPWSRREMKRMCLRRHINRLSSSKRVWHRKRLMNTKRCSLSRERHSTWPPLHNSFSNKANLMTNQPNTTSSNVKTSRNGELCLSLCSKLRSSYPSSP